MDADVAERLLPLQGGVNFRDMGGYATHDGRRTKWRHLFRSGQLSRLTPADEAHLADIGIHSVIDFRTAAEQEREPNVWAPAAGVAYWSRQHHEHFGNLYAMVEAGIESVDHAREIMIGGFRHLPFQQAEAYAELLRRIAAGGVPIVFNCTAGKDRTGGAAALVLAALGVPRETILADFHLTERAVDLKQALRRKPDPAHAAYFKLTPEISAAIGGAHPDYIAALLDEVNTRCGSIEGYMAELGFTASDRAAIRAALLESAP